MSPADPTDSASVTVEGVAATVALDGSFSATVALAPGSNVLHVVATDGYGLQTSITITVVRD